MVRSQGIAAAHARGLPICRHFRCCRGPSPPREVRCLAEAKMDMSGPLSASTAGDRDGAQARDLREELRVLGIGLGVLAYRALVEVARSASRCWLPDEGQQFGQAPRGVIAQLPTVNARRSRSRVGAQRAERQVGHVRGPTFGLPEGRAVGSPALAQHIGAKARELDALGLRKNLMVAIFRSIRPHARFATKAACSMRRPSSVSSRNEAGAHKTRASPAYPTAMRCLWHQVFRTRNLLRVRRIDHPHRHSCPSQLPVDGFGVHPRCVLHPVAIPAPSAMSRCPNCLSYVGIRPERPRLDLLLREAYDATHARDDRVAMHVQNRLQLL